MKRRYFVNYYRNFANTFSLVWVDTKEDYDDAIAKGYERVTSNEAAKLVREEMWRRVKDPAFSGYASVSILPHVKGKIAEQVIFDEPTGLVVQKQHCRFIDLDEED